MQNFILFSLILGLGFFLYLIKTGEINSDNFNIKKLQGPARFEITTTQISKSEKSSTVQLNIRGTVHDIYTFTGSEFSHIPKIQYYEKRYSIPLEAKDAVTGIWLGSRYVFYVIEEEIDGSEFNLLYKVYKTENTTDSQEKAQYTLYKIVKGLDTTNQLEVRY